MKFKLVSVLILSAAFLFISCENFDQPTQNQPEEQQQSLNKPWPDAVDELSQRFIGAFEAGDLETLMSCWWNSPNTLLVLENGVVVVGYDNISAGIEQFINSTEWRTLTVDELISRFRVNDEVYTVGKATWTYQVINGPLVTFQEVWTDVVKKINGNWVIVVDHAHDLTPFAP